LPKIEAHQVSPSPPASKVDDLRALVDEAERHLIERARRAQWLSVTHERPLPDV
jgi:hypothetical protein